MRLGHRHPVRHRREAIFPREHGQQERPFHHGKSRPRTDTAARRKRDIGPPQPLAAVLGLKPCGVERVRIVPDPLMPVQMPGRKHHLRAGVNLAGPKGLGTARLAHHHRHRRIEPHRLAEDRTCGFQLPQSREILMVAQDTVRLRRQPFLPVGMGGEQIERPGQGRGRGFMPGQKEDCHLIDHLVGVEPGAGQRIGGGHDLGRQIFGRDARRNLLHPRRRQPGDQRPDLPRRALGRA